MKGVLLPVKLGTCRLCIRAAFGGTVTSVLGLWVTTTVQTTFIAQAAFAVLSILFGTLSLAHAIAWALRRAGLGYNVAPGCCGELKTPSGNTSPAADAPSRRQFLVRGARLAYAATFAALFPLRWPTRTAAAEETGKSSELLIGAQAERARARVMNSHAYKRAAEALRTRHLQPRLASNEAIVTRITSPGGEEFVQVTLPYWNGSSRERAGVALGVVSAAGAVSAFAWSFVDGRELIYANIRGDELDPAEVVIPEEEGWHIQCFFFICVDWCAVVCAVLAGACGLGCVALCASVCPPCAPYCGLVCAGACGGVCYPTCTRIGH